jgi:7-cyano-7-deazaguanine synthase
MASRDVVVLLSGGLDSAVLLYHLRAEDYRPVALGVNYGQRHARELQAARRVAAAAGVEFVEADATGLLPILAGSSQTTPALAVPHGHYAEATMKATVVPNRNMLLLAMAGALAVSRQAGAVAYAAHAGDHAVYPDCRPRFAQAMAEALALCDYAPLPLLTPFVRRPKDWVVARGAALAVPMGATWSCYEGGAVHCGRCGTCVERAEAFALAGVEDPTDYADPEYWRSAAKPAG